MITIKRFVRLVLLLLLCPAISFADDLEVRSSARIFEKPDSHSTVLATLSPKEREGPYLIRLLQDAKKNGFYNVSVPGKVRDGWIYKSYVRRFHGQHPAYQPYDRSLYRHWIKIDGDCLDTRGRVLVRDAAGQVKYRDEEHCKIAGGTWNDPYTGKVFHDMKKLDIDHMVPLKNAHESGAWAWSAEKRQEYANFLGFRHHLLAVSASENRSKGDKGPDKYLPPESSYRCTYVKDWVKIKEDWELEMTEEEGMTVEKILAQCN